MKWINCKESLPEPNQTVLVNDLNGEGVLIAWRSLWYSNGEPNGSWDWTFQIGGIDSSETKILEWCAIPAVPE